MKQVMILMIAGLFLMNAEAHVAAPMNYELRNEVPVPLNYREVVSSIPYPEKCREFGVEGVVLVKVLVGKDGLIKKRMVINSPDDDMTEIVLRSVMRLQFRPAVVQGEVIERWIGIPVKFKLI